MIRRLLSVATMTVVLVLSVMSVPTQAAGLPSKQEWLDDTAQALIGSRPYVDRQVTSTRGKLALNLDIDNTSLQSRYDPGTAVPMTLRLARYAKRKGVFILFNTGRNVSSRDRTIAELKRAGFPVDGLCTHYKGESLSQSKQRCRQSFVNNGYRLIANIGNRSTDFVGGNYTRAYRLPDYDGQLS